tara:strand:- start:7180 stop:7821 length:642 start_codon:yes stop_codon:yes gene_type:complete
MKSTEMLNQIKTLLNIEVKLEERKLENGTKIEAESFEKGKEIFILTDDERVALPVGEYILESGDLLVVSEEGIIGDMRKVSDEVPQKEDKEGEEITSDLEEEDDYKDDGKEADVADWKGMEKRIKNLEDAIADLKDDKENKMEEVEEQDLEEETQGVLKSRTVKEEFKEELSEASTEPIKHSPESKTSKSNGYLYSQKRVGTALDRVLARLNK